MERMITAVWMWDYMSPDCLCQISVSLRISFDLFLTVDLIIDLLHAEMCASVSQRWKQGKIEEKTKMPY